MVEQKINVEMNGKEYLDYLNRQDLKAEKTKTWLKEHSSLIIGISLIAISAIFIIGTFNTNNDPSIFSIWSNMSWGALLKIGFVMVLISWLLHGVKVRLLA